MKFDLYLSPGTKLNSKWIKDLYLRPITLSLIEENVGKTLGLKTRGNDTLNRVLGTQATLFILIFAYLKGRTLNNGRVPVRKGVVMYLECGTTYLRK